jgi:predicted MFS family arabinose efflux permease
MTAPEFSVAERRLSLFAAIISISIVGASFGHTLPFFAVRQEALGASSAFVGLNAAMLALAALIATPFLPRLMQRLGARTFLIGSLALIGVGIIGILAADARLWAWFPFRLLIGAGGAGAWVASELWILTLAPPERRGAVLGLYATSLAAGFALGPLALEVTGYDGATPFYAPLLMIAASMALIAISKIPQADDAAPSTPMSRLIPQAPVIFGAAAVFAAAEATVMAIGPIYALALGHGQIAAGRIVVVYGLGTVALQFLIGRLSDVLSPKRLIAVCAIIGIAGALILPFAGQRLSTLFPVVFIWGGAIVGLYTVGLNLLGQRYRGPDLAAGNAGMVFCYNFGALLGPVIAGLALDRFGPNGLPATLAVVFGLYLVVLGASQLRRRS